MSSDRQPHADGMMRTMRLVSAGMVLYTQAAADRLGMGPTDLLCCAVLSTTGPVAAGRLAELMGLTTGAITGVVDRLEALGYAQREADPTDRRRVIVRPAPDRVEIDLGGQFARLMRAIAGLMPELSDRELSVVIEFIERATPLLREPTARLRTAAPHHVRRPVAGAEGARI
ncbi:MAG: MarR family winged helix-turn-helix transcriptional regulator [Dehalococcoidia bacterium]